MSCLSCNNSPKSDSSSDVPEKIPIPETNCCVCERSVPVNNSKNGRLMYTCKNCNIICMLEKQSVYIKDKELWVTRPLIEKNHFVWQECPHCKNEVPLAISKSAKNPNKPYLKCTPCGAFTMPGWKYFLWNNTRVNF